MRSARLCFCSLAGAVLAAACATLAPQHPASAVRHVPFTPDSGTIAIRCGR